MSQQKNLNRFLEAQESSYATALAEIQQGRKRSHWMWYIFPQIRGLGYSSTAQFYAIEDAAEAQAYVQHPVLGARLLAICRALLGLSGQNATTILGTPDDLKLRSSMTLFASLPNPDPVFQEVLDKFFRGQPDPQTLRILGL